MSQGWRFLTVEKPGGRKQSPLLAQKTREKWGTRRFCLLGEGGRLVAVNVGWMEISFRDSGA